MRNMLAFLAALVLIFAGLGWYLDWYRLGTSQISEGHRQITIDINTAKIGQDLSKANEKLQNKLADKNKTLTREKKSHEQDLPAWREKHKPIDTEEFFDVEHLDRFLER